MTTSGLDVVQAFVDLASDEILQALDPLDMHHLACAHKSIDALLTYRSNMKTSQRSPKTIDAMQKSLDAARCSVRAAYGDKLHRASQTHKTKFRHFLGIVQRKQRKTLSKDVVHLLKNQFDDFTDDTVEHMLVSSGTCVLFRGLGICVSIHSSYGSSLVFVDVDIHIHSNDENQKGSYVTAVAVAELLGHAKQDILDVRHDHPFKHDQCIVNAFCK